MDKFNKLFIEQTSAEHDSKVLNAAQGILQNKKQPLANAFSLRWLAAAFGVAGLFFVTRNLVLNQNLQEEGAQTDVTKFSAEFPDLHNESLEIVELLADEDLELIENLDLLEEMENV